MTVTAGARSASYLIAGGVTGYAVPFDLIQAADLQVYRHDAVAFDPTEPGDLLTEGVHYTVSSTLGAIAPTGSFPPTGTLTLYRVTSRAQTAAYTPNDGFPAATHETQLDRLSLVDQEHDDNLDALSTVALRLPAGETVTALPAASERAGKVLGFDPVTGEPTAQTYSGAPLGSLDDPSDFEAVSSADVAERLLETTAAVGATLSPNGVPISADLATGFAQLKSDLDRKWRDTANGRIWGNVGKYNRDPVPANNRPSQWTMANLHQNYYWMAKSGGVYAADATSLVTSNFTELLNRQGQVTLSSVTNANDIGAVDDAWFTVEYMLQVHDLTGNATALQIAKDLFAATIANWADPNNSGVGLLYTTDAAAAGGLGHKRVSSLFDLLGAQSALYLYQQTGTQSYLDFATSTYAWIKQRMKHPTFGVLYMEINVDPTSATYLQPVVGSPDTVIMPHYSNVSLWGSLLFCTIAKKLNAIAPNPSYIADVNAMMAAMLRQDTFLRPGNVFTAIRDGWTEGTVFPRACFEVLSGTFAALLAQGLVTRMRKAIVATALSICSLRTNDYYYNNGVTYLGGHYGADWNGIEMGSNGMVSWQQNANLDNGLIALPEQIQTTGMSACVVTAASLIPDVGYTQLVSWPDIVRKVHWLSQNAILSLGAQTIREWLSVKTLYFLNGRPGVNPYLGANGDGDPCIGWADNDYLHYTPSQDALRMNIAGNVVLTANSGGLSALAIGSTTGAVLIGTARDLNFRLEASGNNSVISLDGGDQYGFNRSADQHYFTIANNIYVSIGTGGLTASAITSNGTIGFGGDNLFDLGAPGARARNIYAGNGTIQTSDARNKTVVETPLALLAAIRSVQVKMFQMNDAIAEKGADHARVHAGIIAQDLIAAIEAQGLDWRCYGVIGEDPIMDDQPVMEDVLEPVTEEYEEEHPVLDLDDTGATIVRTETRTLTRNVTELAPVFDTDGKPVMLPAEDAVYEDKPVETTKGPVMVSTLVRDALPERQKTVEATKLHKVSRQTGTTKARRMEADGVTPMTRFSVRYDQLAMLMLAAS